MKTSHHSLSYLALTATCVRAGLVARQGVVGTTTRYWDCCKASCSWSNKAAFSAPVNTCDINDQPLANGRDAASGCNADGQAFMCSDQQPQAIDDTLAYGFAAMTGSSSEADTCCACYKLSFTDQIQGKVMVVQATNIGYDVKSTQFDIALPGGGVGAFPQGCQKQYSAPERGWGTDPGRPYGGVASRSECDQLPAKLQAGCNFRFDWLQGANNPGISYERVSCPGELVAKTGCRRDDDGLYPPAPGSGATVPAPEVPVKVPEPESGSTVPAPDSDTTVPPPSNGGNDGGSNGGNNGDNNGGNGDSGDDCDGDSSDGSTTSARYGQCGGINWTGPSRCAEGAVCQKQNDYYSQCV